MQSSRVHLVLEVLKEPELDVGVVAGQHAGRVVVEEELPAELEVEAVVGLPDPLQDLRRLLLDVFLVVEPHLPRHRPPLFNYEIVTITGEKVISYWFFCKAFSKSISYTMNKKRQGTSLCLFLFITLSDACDPGCRFCLNASSVPTFRRPRR